MGGVARADSDDTKSRLFELPGAAVFPEGIAFDEDSNTMYVGSTTDGAIYSGKRGDKALKVLLPAGGDGRSTAVGMKVDGKGRLFVAGGALGRIFVYDVKKKVLISSFNIGANPSFVNDVALTPNGDAFFTDSQLPVIYRVFTKDNALLAERWLELAGSPIVYTQGFNLNGIAASKDGKTLITVQSNTGKLFKIDVASKKIIEIPTGGAVLTGGDGLLLREKTLYMLRNSAGLIMAFKMSDDFSRAALNSVETRAKFQFPTTLAYADGKLLVVNSQFDKRQGVPSAPFNVLQTTLPDSGDGDDQIAQLKGANVTGGGDPDGTGRAIIDIEQDKGQICFDVDIKGVVLPASSVRIHTGAAGTAGPMVVDLGKATDTRGKVRGCANASLPLMTAIWSNPAGYYVSVQDAAFPNGALRGQLELLPEKKDND
jgi:sugar lactone lactonase YvrE